MVKVSLQLMCRFENIAEVKAAGPGFNWCLKLFCSNCKGTTDKWHYISLEDATPVNHDSNICHFVCKCKTCSRENTITIMEDSIEPYTKNDEGQYKTIVIFDCRGLEPCDFSLREGWTVQVVHNGTTFTDVDLGAAEWVDYCAEIREPVGIYDMEHRFLRAK